MSPLIVVMLGQVRQVAAYLASGLCVVLVSVLGMNLWPAQMSATAISEAAFLWLVAVTLIPLVWVLIFALAFMPIWLAAAADRYLRSRQVSRLWRGTGLGFLAIALSLPFLALFAEVYRFDGWPFVWPLVILGLVIVSSRELWRLTDVEPL